MSVSSIPSGGDYSSPYASQSAAATSGNLLASQFASQSVSSTNALTSTATTPVAPASTALSSYESSHQNLISDDAQELLNGSFGSSNALNQSTLSGNALISATTDNTVNVLAQWATLQGEGYQTAQTAQAASTAAASAAAAQNAQDNAVLAAPIDPVDPYAAPGSADPLNLLGQTVDTTA